MARNDISDKVYGIIYKIENKVNGKVYIGQTIQKGGFDARYGKKWWENTHNSHLKRAVEKHGVDNFEVTKVLKKCYKESTLNKSEADFIKQYDSTNPKKGYNKTTGGDNYKLSEDTKEKMSSWRFSDILNKVDTRNPFDNMEWYSIVKYGEIRPRIDIYKDVEDTDICSKVDDIDLLDAYFVMNALQSRFYSKVGLDRYISYEYDFDSYASEDDDEETIRCREFCKYFNIYEYALDVLFDKKDGKYYLIEKLKDLGYIVEDDPIYENTKRYKIVKKIGGN